MNEEQLLEYFEMKKQEKITAGTWNVFSETQHNMALADISGRFRRAEEVQAETTDATSKYKNDPTLIW